MSFTYLLSVYYEGQKRATVNAAILGLITTRKNDIFGIFISSP